MKRIAILLLFVITASTAAQDVDLDTRFNGASPLDKARQAYDQKVAQAQEQYNARATMLHDQYLKQLRGMAVTTKRTGTKEQVQAIENEIKEMEDEGPLRVGVTRKMTFAESSNNQYGLWKVTVSDDHYRIYKIYPNGTIRLLEYVDGEQSLKGNTTMQVRRIGDSLVFDFREYTEAFSAGTKKGTLRWARWHKADFPNGKPVDEGIATFHGEAIE